MAKRVLRSESESELPDLQMGHADIKSLFRTGAIPREMDYASLIEYVHYLHKLLGIEGSDPSHTPQLGGGLVLNESGVLSVLGFESPVPADAWISNMASRLGATHIALSDECTVFFAGSYISGANITVATGFVKNANTFPSVIGSPTGFTLGGNSAYWPDDGNSHEGFLSSGTFTLGYNCELIEGLEYKLKIRLSPLSVVEVRTLKVVVIG